MIVLGIDPGFATVGYGIVKCENGVFTPISYGAITTPPHTLIEKRLKEIYPQINIVFVTAYSKYTDEAFSLHASGYIYKPVYGRVGEKIGIKEACEEGEFNKILKEVK